MQKLQKLNFFTCICSSNNFIDSSLPEIGVTGWNIKSEKEWNWNLYVNKDKFYVMISSIAKNACCFRPLSCTFLLFFLYLFPVLRYKIYKLKPHFQHIPVNGDPDQQHILNLHVLFHVEWHLCGIESVSKYVNLNTHQHAATLKDEARVAINTDCQLMTTYATATGVTLY